MFTGVILAPFCHPPSQRNYNRFSTVCMSILRLAKASPRVSVLSWEREIQSCPRWTTDCWIRQSCDHELGRSGHSGLYQRAGAWHLGAHPAPRLQNCFLRSLSGRQREPWVLLSRSQLWVHQKSWIWLNGQTPRQWDRERETAWLWESGALRKRNQRLLTLPGC